MIMMWQSERHRVSQQASTPPSESSASWLNVLCPMKWNEDDPNQIRVCCFLQQKCEVLLKGLVDLGFSLKDAESMAAKPCEDRKVLWCNSDGFVSNLFAAHRGLAGTLSKELASLRGLEYIGLENNKLKGSIPSEFGELVTLEQLDLSNNQLLGQKCLMA